MMDYWTLTGLSNDQISKAFLASIEEEHSSDTRQGLFMHRPDTGPGDQLRIG